MPPRVYRTCVVHAEQCLSSLPSLQVIYSRSNRDFSHIERHGGLRALLCKKWPMLLNRIDSRLIRCCLLKSISFHTPVHRLVRLSIQLCCAVPLAALRSSHACDRSPMIPNITRTRLVNCGGKTFVLGPRARQSQRRIENKTHCENHLPRRKTTRRRLSNRLLLSFVSSSWRVETRPTEDTK